jgi:nucleoside-diphosphate-sugar epimerase
MAILITGATGYIGSVLTQQMALQGEEIHLLCRKDPGLKEFQQPNIRIFEGDITNPGSVLESMKGVDKVYHMAAYARVWAKDKSVFYRINVDGTRNVLKAALDCGIRKVVYTSTAAVIGPSAGKAMTENDPRITGIFNPYEETKTEAEQVTKEFVQRGLPVVVLNPSRVYGPGLDSGSNPYTKIMELYLKGKWKIIPGSGNDIGSYCYIDDVVEGILMAMEKGRSGERYIIGGINATFNEFINAIRKASGMDKKLRHIPFSILSILSHLQVAYANLTGKPPMITPDWVKKYDFDWALDSSKAIREFGYKIRPLDQGVAQTIDWLKRNRL